MEINEAIKKLRAQKNEEGTPGFMIYRLLENAHPVVREVIEYQAAQALRAGETVGEAFREASATKEGRDFLEKKFSELSSKINAATSFENEETGDEDD
jgi:hypothetical protein